MNSLDRADFMYSNTPNFVIGFHGCDKSVSEKIIHGKTGLKKSENEYDWLGHGMYFWEQNLERAREWAKEGAKNPNNSIKEPAVIGAVIDLGFCLNLLDSNNIKILKNQYEIFELEMDIAGKKIKQNRDVKGNSDLLLRFLDCAVIEHLHQHRKTNNQIPFDTVRGVFLEGEPIYETSGFREKSHIQICVRNPNCIKGFFEPRDFDKRYPIV